MTTIAADLETMASDSKVTVDAHSGTSYRATKIVKMKHMIVGACGDGGDCSRFLEWAERDFKLPIPKWKCAPADDDSLLALVLNKDGLHAVVQTDPAPEKMDEPFFAVGSGGKAARVAMRLGKTPEEAVLEAIAVDDHSGPPVQVLTLKDKAK